MQEGKSLGQVAYEVTRDCVDPSGTVWDFIKMTDKMYPNTRIPKSFELQVGSQRFWVAPNATKHMRDYVSKAIDISHNMPINSQVILKSFHVALDQAAKDGINFEQLIKVGSWEFKIGMPRQGGLLPVIYHADFRPYGF